MTGWQGYAKARDAYAEQAKKLAKGKLTEGDGDSGRDAAGAVIMIVAAELGLAVDRSYRSRVIVRGGEPGALRRERLDGSVDRATAVGFTLSSCASASCAALPHASVSRASATRRLAPGSAHWHPRCR